MEQTITVTRLMDAINGAIRLHDFVTARQKTQDLRNALEDFGVDHHWAAQWARARNEEIDHAQAADVKVVSCTVDESSNKTSPIVDEILRTFCSITLQDFIDFSNAYLKNVGLVHCSTEADAERDYWIGQGVDPKDLGPSGKPKIHVVDHGGRKNAKDAARNEGKSNSDPVSHPSDEGQPPHFHPTRDGDKLTLKQANPPPGQSR